jgi:hypothetical protein
MISVSGISSHILDSEVTTDESTTDYTFSINSISDGGILLIAVSLTTSTTSHCSYLLAIHKQNNIGATVATLSSKTYNGLSITFSATYTTITLTLSSAIAGTLKISPVILNA